MAACRGSSSRWFFTREQLETTPSRRCGVEPDRELSYRQQAANLIQDMGQRLNVSQLTINTAIVYMHRFYMYHSFTKFHRNIISPTTLFLAAKVEEQPRKLEHVIKVAHACLNPQEAPLDTKSNAYLQQAQELVILETIVLQTLGFEITIDHPHTDVVKCSQLVRASKDLAQTSYFMATNSLHLTTFCLQHKPTVIACVCIHLACKWSNWEIPVSTDGKHWWEYVDPSVTLELLDELTHEFLQILEKTPSRLKRIRNWRATQAAKKPKADGQAADSSFLGPSLIQDHSLVDSLPGASNSAPFPKASASFPVAMPSNPGGRPLSLDGLAPMPGTYTFTAPNDWPADPGLVDAYTLKPDSLALPSGAPLSLHASLQPPRPDKGPEFPPVKHEHKAGKHLTQLPYAAPMPPPQKMSLEKYREKHAAELVGQRRRQEQGSDTEARDAYAHPALVDAHHRKHPHAHLQQLPGCSTASSPLKMKLPPPGADRHPTDKRDKASALKLRLPVPPGDKEELKMKIKVSSDESASRSKHSSPLVVGKEKHREHGVHRHHKHGHGHLHTHSGNGRGGPQGALRSPVGASAEATGPGPSRKRAHPDAASHNHHSKSSKSSKSAGSASRCSSVRQCVSADGSVVVNHPFPPPPPPVAYQVGYGHLSTLVKLDRSQVESLGSEGGGPGANGLQTDYKDTFDMLDSLLSAQGMNS
ncbi:cyclin-T2a isoform X1 [Brienomyrus brachyistius]|uniref:cyclin-T2a isoform X1 n=1 Tax=Brienomyrus brachyistius TaxID=42636 RepID=UPI0020B21BDC|nr:cyclin-T2a isoform X1 [Brienomyrus brachyistius]